MTNIYIYVIIVINIRYRYIFLWYFLCKRKLINRLWLDIIYLTCGRLCDIIYVNQGGEAIIWFEMSYNNYWAYRDLSLSQRCENEPDDSDIDDYQEQEEDN